MSAIEFDKWLQKLKVARTVLYLQQHHTYIPSYEHFNGSNHFKVQLGMKDHHVNENGWSDIGQHFSIFPDGTVLTGRSLERTPACIYGKNSHSICIENVGNFDKNGDDMTTEQRQAIFDISASICRRFSIPVNTERIVYHHWFNLSTGERNNGSGGNKSCPGTNFFGGNKVEDCKKHFLPGLRKALKQNPDPIPEAPAVNRHVSVRASVLNIRKGAGTGFDRVQDRAGAIRGAILRVYREKNGWLKISSNKNHWVAGNYTDTVSPATVKATKLNVRSGPSMHYRKIGSVTKGEAVFIYEEIDGWCRIGHEERWVSKAYLKV